MKEILRVYSKSDLEHFMAWCPVSIPSNYCNYFSAYVKWWPGCTTTLIFQINIVFLTPWFRLKKYPCKGQTNGRNPFSTCLHTKPSFLLNAKVNPLFQQLPLAKLHPKKHFSWSMSFPPPPRFPWVEMVVAVALHGVCSTQWAWKLEFFKFRVRVLLLVSVV